MKSLEEHNGYDFEKTSPKRNKSKKIKVTLPDERVICFENNTITFIETLRVIGIEKLKNLDLTLCHLPLFSKEIYPKYKEWMKPLDGGWYVNTQSDSETKYLQLKLIINHLKLDIKLELDENFEPFTTKESLRLKSIIQKMDMDDELKSFLDGKIICPNKEATKKRVPSKCLMVKTPDRNIIHGDSAQEVYIETMKWIGYETLKQKVIELEGKIVVTPYKLYNSQHEVEKGTWVTVPPDTNRKFKALRVLNAILKLNLEISLI